MYLNARLIFTVAFFLNALSLIFAIFSFAIYRHYREQASLDLTLWALLLFLPACFISAFSIEADILVSTLIVISTYFFILFLNRNTYSDLVFSAIYVGLAALAKYSGLVIALFFGIVLLIRYLRDTNISSLKKGLAYALIVFLVGSYPYINNLLTSGTLIVGNKAWNTGNNYSDHYNFTNFSIKRIIRVFTHPAADKLKHYPAYNTEVLSSHYGQLWTPARTMEQGRYLPRQAYARMAIMVHFSRWTSSCNCRIFRLFCTHNYS